MIVTGVILIVIALLFDLGNVLMLIGAILAVVGAIIWILGAMGRQIGPRTHYY